MIKVMLWYIKIGMLLTLAIFVSFSSAQPCHAQVDEEFFQETGHWIKGDFLEYFYRYGGLEVFGYPITEPFIDQGVLVQYFQNVRMEWHPRNPDPYKVQLGLLGDELRYRHPPVPAPTTRSRRRVYFPETGHTIAYAFLDFYIERGQLDIFGYPITEMHFEDGKIVQYFQRLKIEWHPDDPTSAVRIANLGELYVSIYKDRMPPNAIAPQSPADGRIETSPTLSPQITGLRAVVSLRYSVMSQKQDQIVSVLITDNNGKPLENANVTINFISAGKPLAGGTRNNSTDARGFVQMAIPITGGASGTQIIVQADVTYQHLSTTAQNVFLLWW